MISKTLDTLISKMEQSTDEDQAVAASCLRIDVTRFAETHACYRCQKASWMMQRQDAPPARPGQPAPVFQWAIDLGACGAFMPVVMAMRPEGPFFCSAEKSDVAGGGFALASGERQGSGSAGWGEVQTPRQRGDGQGE